MTQTKRLNYLIEALLHEQKQYLAIQIPQNTLDKKRLLRSLMNIRPPVEASGEFLKIQDEYLQREIADKGITDGTRLVLLRNRLSLWQGDITTLKCGAIVNAANSRMLGCFTPCHGCIDNAIHTYAGIQLRMECARQMNGGSEKTGMARITKAYNLPCDYIIHTVGPIVSGQLTKKHCQQLASCYRSCLKTAEQHNIKSIALCCISTGEFRFPNGKAAEIAVQSVEEYLKNSNIERVIFNVFKDEDKEIYSKLLG